MFILFNFKEVATCKENKENKHSWLLFFFILDFFLNSFKIETLYVRHTCISEKQRLFVYSFTIVFTGKSWHRSDFHTFVKAQFRPRAHNGCPVTLSVPVPGIFKNILDHLAEWEQSGIPLGVNYILFHTAVDSGCLIAPLS